MKSNYFTTQIIVLPYLLYYICIENYKYIIDPILDVRNSCKTGLSVKMLSAIIPYLC